MNAVFSIVSLIRIDILYYTLKKRISIVLSCLEYMYLRVYYVIAGYIGFFRDKEKMKKRMLLSRVICIITMVLSTACAMIEVENGEQHDCIKGARLEPYDLYRRDVYAHGSYRRKFARGIVMVNPQEKELVVTFAHLYQDVTTREISASFPIPAKDGRIYLRQ
jgi:hypothetical protein